MRSGLGRREETGDRKCSTRALAKVDRSHLDGSALQRGRIFRKPPVGLLRCGAWHPLVPGTGVTYSRKAYEGGVWASSSLASPPPVRVADDARMIANSLTRARPRDRDARAPCAVFRRRRVSHLAEGDGRHLMRDVDQLEQEAPHAREIARYYARRSRATAARIEAAAARTSVHNACQLTAAVKPRCSRRRSVCKNSR